MKPLPKSPIWCTTTPFAKSRKCNGSSCKVRGYPGRTEKNGRAVFVDCDVEGGRAPDGTNEGRGVSHFQTCENVNEFNGGRRM